MTYAKAADVWTLACKLFATRAPTMVAALSCREAAALPTLREAKAIQARTVDARFLLCPYCQLHRGAVVREIGGTLVCQCPDCGPVHVDAAEVGAVVLDVDWLIRKLRGALDVPASQVAVPLVDSVWRIGTLQGAALILASSLDRLLHQPAIVARARLKRSSAAFLLTPKPLRDVDTNAFDDGLTWLPLEEHFNWYGGSLSFAAPDLDQASAPLSADKPSAEPYHGPFSEDFRWVRLAGQLHDPVALSPAQAAVFRALWSFSGEPRPGSAVMARAGLKGDKPGEVFKVKTANKGKAEYEAPKLVYSTLVSVNSREGIYALKPT
jgi:hypothetical protein